MNQIYFQAFGVDIGIEAVGNFNLGKISKSLGGIFPTGYQITEKRKTAHLFTIVEKESEKFGLYKNDETIFTDTTEDNLINFLESHLRGCVAEFAVDKLFVHAGVVEWQGKALVLPGASFAGKTTLVAELIRRGRAYYSDEYAVVDEDGLIHPYPKKLSIRGIIDDVQQSEFAVEELNGKPGIKPLPVGAVLIAVYEKGGQANIKTLSRGHGLMEIIGHSFAFRHNPERVLRILSKACRNALFFKAERGEAVEFVDFFTEYVENNKKTFSIRLGNEDGLLEK